ncbi:MAG: c-type cytochrome [Anaerolineae bacterium]
MFERMLVGGIENRITLGLISFLLTMVFLGWAAINEGGRMQAFQVMEEARSIEQGAMTFAANCTGCHGLDGRGSARAPGLNNPQFFDHDFFPEITKQVSDMSTEKTQLTAEQTAEGTTDTRKAEITARISEIDTTIAALNADRASKVEAAVAKGYDPARFSRLANLSWVGTHESFIQTTLIHGRPVSSHYWPQPMAAWSQIAGGPLRMDQIEDLVAYIENFDKGENWQLDDLFAVNQFAIEPVDGAPLEAQIELLQQSGGVLPTPVGTDVATVIADLANVTGDATRGSDLYHNVNGAKSGLGNVLPCASCHIQSANGTGPMSDGTFTRVENERLKEPQFANYTAEQYLVESILLPNAYTVPGYTGVMPPNFGEQLTIQDLADILAYLETLK